MPQIAIFINPCALEVYISSTRNNNIASVMKPRNSSAITENDGCDRLQAQKANGFVDGLMIMIIHHEHRIGLDALLKLGKRYYPTAAGFQGTHKSQITGRSDSRGGQFRLGPLFLRGPIRMLAAASVSDGSLGRTGAHLSHLLRL